MTKYLNSLLQSIRLSKSMTLRDWRAGELNFLLLALALAVTSLTAVNFFVDRLQTGLQTDANQMLAADLVVSGEQELKSSWKQKAESQLLAQAQTANFPSMLRTTRSDDFAAGVLLASIKAVSATYPLRGKLTIRTDKGESSQAGGPASGEIWVEQAVLDRLQLKLGDQASLGEKTFRITALIVNEPDRGGGFVSLLPRVMLSMADLGGTQLVQPGSRITWDSLFAGDEQSVKSFEVFIRNEIKQQKIQSVFIKTLESSQNDLFTALDRAQQFLRLVSLLSTLLAAVAIALAARRFMLRHIDACAMLKCLGQTQSQLTRMYAIEFLLVGLCASVLGVALGFAGHFAILYLLRDVINTQLPAPSFYPAVQGLVTGLILLLGFALPPILQLRNIPHNRVIRRETSAPKLPVLFTYGLGLLGFAGVLWSQEGAKKIMLYTGAGVIVSMIVFAVVAVAFLFLLKLLLKLKLNLSWRFAIQAILRRKFGSVGQLVALSIGLMALLLLTIVRSDIVDTWKKSTPSNAANHFLLNILPEQKEEIEAKLAKFSKPELYPMMRGRMVKINNEVLATKKLSDESNRRSVERELGLSASKELPPQNEVIRGKWFSGNDDNFNQVSLEERFAKNADIQLGDTIDFEVAGETIQAKVTSIRKLEWQSMRTNFVAILDPRLLKDYPTTYITSFHLPESETKWLAETVRTYPNITILDLRGIIAKIQSIMNQVVQAVEFLFFFTLLSGIFVLYAALLATQEVRIKESALLRAFGASRAQLSRAQWIELGLMGGVAGFMAAAAASGLGYALIKFTFNLSWTFSPSLFLFGVIAGASCSLLGGFWSLRQVLNQPPLISLRESV